MTRETDKVSFTQMKDGNYEDYQLLKKLEKPYLNLTASRIIDELKRQGEATLEGYRITRLDHGLQSATRAEADGVDIDWIVGALLHDIGDGLAPQNHDKFEAPEAELVDSNVDAPGRTERYSFCNKVA